MTAEGHSASSSQKRTNETVSSFDAAQENSTGRVEETNQPVEPTVVERIFDDADIKAMQADILERTNRDGQVQRALQDGRTSLGDSYQSIHGRVERREEIHAVDRFVAANQEKAQQYASRWDALRTQYPQIENLPAFSFNGSPDIYSWAKENHVDLPMDANDLSLARDFSRSLEQHRRKAAEEERLSEAQAEAKRLASHRTQLEGAEQQLSVDQNELNAVRQRLGFEAAPARPSDANIERLRESIHHEATVEDVGGNESAETGTRFFREAPSTMHELDTSSDETAADEAPWTPEEREQLTEVRDFLDSAAEIARASQDEQMAREIEEYKEHFSFIGERQFGEAIEGMTRLVEQKVAQGKKVILFPFGKRSEKFVTERLFDKVRASPFGKDVVVESNPYTLAKKVAENPDKTFIYIPDDFVISGARLEGAAQMLTGVLAEHGINEETSKSIITPLAVAGTDKKFRFGSKPFVYYRSGTFDNHPWPAVTGYHASTDYGFQNSLERFRKYMEGRGVKRSLPKLTKVKKPYES